MGSNLDFMLVRVDEALEKPLCLKHLTGRPPGRPDHHNNTCARFILVLEGIKNLWMVDGRGRRHDVTLAAGEAIFGAPGNRFRDCWDTPHRMLSMVFQPRSVRCVAIEHDGVSSSSASRPPENGYDLRREQPGWKACYYHTHTPPDPVGQALLQTLNLAAETEPGELPGGDELFRALLLTMHRVLERDIREAPIPADEVLWREIAGYISEHFTEPLNRSDVARFFRIHPDHLSRLFRHHEHAGFVESLNHRRLTLARELLANSRLPVGEVARLAGFENSSYFIRCFRKQFGCTPGEQRGLDVAPNSGARSTE